MSETITTNRGLWVVDAGGVPTPPEEFKPSTTADIQALRKIGEKAEAEAILALEECELRGDALSKELGNDVPSVESLAALKTRKKKIVETKARALYLLQYLEELDDIVNNDIALALEATNKEFEHNAEKRPQLRQSYPALQRYSKSHGDSVREGLARSKQKKENP
jgi:hypothetical protein